MTMSLFAQGHADSGSSNTNTASAVYPAGIVAGDLLIVSVGMNAGFPASPPPGYLEIIKVSTSFCGAAAYFKIADGTESGTTLNFALGGAYFWSMQITCFHTTGKFTAASCYSALSDSTTVDNDQFTAPDPGTVAAGCFGWGVGFAVSGSPGTRTVTGSFWTISGGWNWGPAFPNQESMITAYKSPGGAGAPTFRYGTANDFDALCGLTFLMQDFPGPAAGLFFGTNA